MSENDRATLRRRRRAEFEEIRNFMTSNTMSVQGVQDWRHDGQLVLRCSTCDWTRVALNATLAELETTAHVGTETHLARLAEAVDSAP